MKILFTDCWVGWYVGDGNYEGGTCPDCLITNVSDNIDESDLFDLYLMCLCSGCNEHDQKDYTTKVVKRLPRGKTPIQITSLDELENCNEEFIKVDFNDLIEWVDEYC